MIYGVMNLNRFVELQEKHMIQWKKFNNVVHRSLTIENIMYGEHLDSLPNLTYTSDIDEDAVVALISGCVALPLFIIINGDVVIGKKLINSVNSFINGDFTINLFDKECAYENISPFHRRRLLERTVGCEIYMNKMDEEEVKILVSMFKES
jgi:hypothetical protein